MEQAENGEIGTGSGLQSEDLTEAGFKKVGGENAKPPEGSPAAIQRQQELDNKAFEEILAITKHAREQTRGTRKSHESNPYEKPN